MSDSPENLPETAASGADADAKRRAAIKAALLAAPAVLTLMARSSLALADNNGTPGLASAGSTSVVHDNNGNHYGWGKSSGQGTGNAPAFAADPQPAPPASASTSSSSAASSSSATSPVSSPSTAETSKGKENAKETGVGTASK